MSKKREWELIGAIDHKGQKLYILRNLKSAELFKTTSIKKAVEYVGEF